MSSRKPLGRARAGRRWCLEELPSPVRGSAMSDREYRGGSRVWRYLPLLGALGLASSAALSMLTTSIDQPVYEGLLWDGLVAGLLSSAFSVWRRRPVVLPGALVLLFAFSSYVLRDTGFPLAEILYPPQVLADQDLRLAALIGWMLVAFSFWQGRRLSLIFPIVCGLTIFGLIGTINLNREFRVGFVLFMLAAVFCWSYEQYLEIEEKRAARGLPPAPVGRRMIYAHLSLAVLAVLLSYGVGSALGAIAYRLSPNLFARMPRELYGWTPGGEIGRRLFYTFEPEFRVGTGPIRLLPWPVAEIKAERPALWRALAYDEYDGRGWRRSLAYRTETLRFDGQAYRVPQRFLPRHFRPLQQRVRLLGNVGALLAAAQPALVRVPLSRAPRRFPRMLVGMPVLDSYGCLAAVPGDSVSEYVVVSYLPVKDPAALRQAGRVFDARITAAYTRLPSETIAVLQPLVQKIVAGQKNAYDKVLALERFLQRECVYTLSAPATPPGQDPVVYFLLRSRRGACDLFASALAVMARIAGVPARVATGFQTGRFEAEKEAFVIEGRDAHAWAEIYFPRYGWIAFDPQAETAEEDSFLSVFVLGDGWRSLWRDFRRLTLAGGGALLLFFLAIAAFVDPLRLLRVFSKHPRTPLEWLCHDLQALYKEAFRHWGLNFSHSWTPQEALGQLRRAFPSSSGRLELWLLALERLNERFYALRYGRERPTASEIESLRKDVQMLRQRRPRTRAYLAHSRR